jgi:hypothetical protein
MGFFDKIPFLKKDDGFGKDELALPPLEPMTQNNPSNYPGDETFPQQILPNFQNPQMMGQEEYAPDPRPSMPMGQALRTPSTYPNPSYEVHESDRLPASQNLISKELEIISSKLDYLRVSLENINQRLANLEKVARDDNTPQPPRYRW